MKSHNSHRPNKAIILSAGFGSRLRPITDTVPKALVEVAGKPMLQRNIEMVKDLGINNIIINTHYLSDKIKTFCDGIRGVDITIIHEPDILETGGGILNIMQEVANEPMLVVNCDIMLDSTKPIQTLLEKWDPNNMELLALLEENKPIYNRKNGDFNLSRDGKLLNEGVDKKYIFLGAYIISPEFFKGYKVHKFRVPEIIFKEAGENHKFYGVKNSATWFDIGSHESLKTANDHFLKL